MAHDEFGREIPDPTPLAIPVGYGEPESLSDTIKRMIRNEMSAYASSQEQETFDEANDFEIEDDNLQSEYELTEMQEEFVPEQLTKPNEGDKLKSQSQSAEKEDGQEQNRTSEQSSSKSDTIDSTK